MKFRKKEISEIIDTHGELIGVDDIPTNGSNMETRANNTTDYNAKIGTQPFRYDMLGRFGFSLMPFMEGEEKNVGRTELEGELVNLMFDRYKEILNFYYKNPNKLKPDYRKMTADDADPQKEVNVKYAEKIIGIVGKHFEDSVENIDEIHQENMAEGKVIETMVDRKEDEMATKSDSGDVRNNKIEKIAGLINKLEKKDIDRLINLLEKKNG